MSAIVLSVAHSIFPNKAKQGEESYVYRREHCYRGPTGRCGYSDHSYLFGKKSAPQLTGLAATVAINENPANYVDPATVPLLAHAAAAHAGPAIGFIITKLWKPGRTLRVRFLDNPSALIRQKIETFAQEWTQYADIHFAFGTDPDAEIRISTNRDGASWSYLGTDALTTPQSQPTMHYGWFTDTTSDEEFSRTVLHEFGHALSAIHEHQNPLGNIPWDREKVYAYYQQTQHWSRSQVDSQIFAHYDKTTMNTDSYDKLSIMHYPIPAALTLNGYSVGWNCVLSDKDKQFIKTQYP